MAQEYHICQKDWVERRSLDWNGFSWLESLQRSRKAFKIFGEAGWKRKLRGILVDLGHLGSPLRTLSGFIREQNRQSKEDRRGRYRGKWWRVLTKRRSNSCLCRAKIIQVHFLQIYGLHEFLRKLRLLRSRAWDVRDSRGHRGADVQDTRWLRSYRS